MRIKMEIQSHDDPSVSDLVERIAEALNILYELRDNEVHRGMIEYLIDILEGNEPD